jgi:hypothetical protein
MNARRSSPVAAGRSDRPGPDHRSRRSYAIHQRGRTRAAFFFRPAVAAAGKLIRSGRRATRAGDARDVCASFLGGKLE